jgi:hypothetical protein
MIKVIQIFVFFVLATNSFAQDYNENKPKEIRVIDEIYFGINHTILYGKNGRFGFNFGLNWDVKLSKSFALDFGLEYSSKRFFDPSDLGSN